MRTSLTTNQFVCIRRTYFVNASIVCIKFFLFSVGLYYLIYVIGLRRQRQENVCWSWMECVIDGLVVSTLRGMQNTQRAQSSRGCGCFALRVIYFGNRPELPGRDRNLNYLLAQCALNSILNWPISTHTHPSRESVGRPLSLFLLIMGLSVSGCQVRWRN